MSVRTSPLPHTRRPPFDSAGTRHPASVNPASAHSAPEARSRKDAFEPGPVLGNVKREVIERIVHTARRFDRELEVRGRGLTIWTSHLLERIEASAPFPLQHGPISENPEMATNGKRRDPYTYGTIENGSLYVDGISADDFTQASLGNCALLASLASVAHSRPDLIEDMIQDNHDGTYTVRFYSDDGSQRHEVVVDDQLPLTASGSRGYTQARDKSELWLSIIEKAYAVYRGGSYDAIESQSPAVVLTHLTGGKKSVYGTQHGDDRIYGQLERALGEGRFVVAGTNPITDNPATPEREKNDPAFVAPHAYSVLAVHERDGEKFVVLRNPWGRHEYGSDGKNDGTFEVPLAVFTEQFSYADVVG